MTTPSSRPTSPRLQPTLLIALGSWLLVATTSAAVEPQSLVIGDERPHSFTSIELADDASRVLVGEASRHNVWDRRSGEYLGRVTTDDAVLTADARSVVGYSNERVLDPQRRQYQVVHRLQQFDAATLRSQRVVEGLHPLVLSPDGKIAAELLPDESVVLRDAQTLEPLPNSKLSPGDFSGPPRSVRKAAFTPDGARLWLWTREGLYVWHVAERKLAHTLDAGWTKGRSFGNIVEFAPDGSFALLRLAYEPSESNPNDVDRVNGRNFVLVDVPNDYQVRWARRIAAAQVVIAPNSRWIVAVAPALTEPDAAGRVAFTGGSEFKIVEPAGGNVVHTFTADDHFVTGMDIAADGTLVTCGKEGKVLVWNWNEIEKTLPKAF